MKQIGYQLLGRRNPRISGKPGARDPDRQIGPYPLELSSNGSRAIRRVEGRKKAPERSRGGLQSPREAQKGTLSLDKKKRKRTLLNKYVNVVSRGPSDCFPPRAPSSIPSKKEKNCPAAQGEEGARAAQSIRASSRERAARCTEGKKLMAAGRGESTLLISPAALRQHQREIRRVAFCRALAASRGLIL